MKRRTFLVGGLATIGVIAGASALRVGTVWWDQPAAAEYQVLSEGEARIAGAIVDALFPGDHLGMPNGRGVGVVEALDEYLAAIDAGTANLLRLVLHAINEAAYPTKLGFKPFYRREREERLEILHAWDTSKIEARKQAFFALKLVLSMGYCEAPAVIRAARIDYECGGWQ